MKITVQKLTDDEIKDKGIRSWPIWEKEASMFDWFYGDTEECLLLEGRVIVETDEGSIEFRKGDFVTFPKGLSCVWDIKEDVKKHYNFS